MGCGLGRSRSLLLQRRGHEHEATILAGYRAQGLTIVEPAQPSWKEGRNGGWARCAAETFEMMRCGADVIYQACLFEWMVLTLKLLREKKCVRRSPTGDSAGYPTAGDLPEDRDLGIEIPHTPAHPSNNWENS